MKPVKRPVVGLIHLFTIAIRLLTLIEAGQLSDEEILTVLERAAVETRQILAQYAQIPQNAQSYAQRVGSPREAFFWMLTLEYGTLAMQAQLEWIESAIQRTQARSTLRSPSALSTRQADQVRRHLKCGLSRAASLFRPGGDISPLD